MTAKPVDELSQFKSTRASMHAILAALASTPRGELRDKSGLVMQKLEKLVPPEHWNTNTNQLINRLRANGWIELERRGKRTYRVKLLEPYGPQPSPAVIAATAVEWEPAVTTSIPGPVTVGVQPFSDEEGLGMRPGRLAARLEKQIPELVEQAVAQTLGGMLDLMFANMGYHKTNGIDPHELQAANQQLEVANAQLRDLTERKDQEISQLNGMIEFMSAEEHRRLRGTNDGQQATKQGLTSSQVPEVLRRTAEQFIQAGGVIYRTRGSHLMWKLPNGEFTYTGTTPGTKYADALLRSTLRRTGFSIGE